MHFFAPLHSSWSDTALSNCSPIYPLLGYAVGIFGPRPPQCISTAYSNRFPLGLWPARHGFFSSFWIRKSAPCVSALLSVSLLDIWLSHGRAPARSYCWRCCCSEPPKYSSFGRCSRCPHSGSATISKFPVSRLLCQPIIPSISFDSIAAIPLVPKVLSLPYLSVYLFMSALLQSWM